MMQMSMQVIVYEKMDPTTTTRQLAGESQHKKRKLHTMTVRKVADDEEYTQPSNASDVNNVNDQPKKNLYLHAGPGKMATTTVQNAIRKDISLLEEDGYCTYEFRHFDWHQSTVESITSNRFWEPFLAQLDKCHQMNQHVILSNEGLMGFHVEVWNDLLEPLFSRWNVVQLAGYRRYYDWKASLYGQQLKDHDKYTSAIKGHLLRTNGDTLYTVRNMQKFKKLVLHQEQLPEITAQEVRDQRLGDQNPNKYKFAIYNLNEGPNVLKTLYCNVLPTTYKCCDKYTNQLPPHDNQAIPVEYYRLILGGIAENKFTILDMPQDRNAALKTKTKLAYNLKELWEEDWNKTITDFPRDCLSTEQLQGLFDKSMAFEQLLVPDYFEKEMLPRLAEVKQEFDDMANVKYCGVQINDILHAEEYKYIWDGLDDMISGQNVE